MLGLIRPADDAVLVMLGYGADADMTMARRKSRICKAKNLSAKGVFVETENLGLRKGQQVQRAFAINLGLVTKIHRRTAIVAHVTRGGTGLMMEHSAGR